LALETASDAVAWSGRQSTKEIFIMIVQDVSGLPPTLKGLLTTNPFDSDLRNVKSTVENIANLVEQSRSNANEYARKVEEQKLIAQIEKQKLVNEKKRLKAIETAFNVASESVDASYLETSKLVSFFNSIGCKFVKLNFHSNQERAQLEYIRYGGFISLLPVPPMLITMRYERKNGKLAFKKAEVFTVFHNGNYIHPHVSSYSICMGNYYDVLDQNDYSILLDGYQEHAILLNNLLSTYNPDSPYRTIDRIIGDTAKRLTFDSKVEISFDDYNNFTFINPEIDRRYTEIYRLIGRDACQIYLDNLQSIKLKDVAEDLYARLLCETHDSSDSEMYDAMSGMEDDISRLLPNVGWSSLSEFSTTEEDEDDNGNEYNTLQDDNFEDLISAWRNELRDWIDDECGDSDCLVFKMIPSLDDHFASETRIVIDESSRIDWADVQSIATSPIGSMVPTIEELNRMFPSQHEVSDVSN